MKTFLHILIGFILGVVCTLGVLFVMTLSYANNQQAQFSTANYYKVNTPKGIVTIRTGMPRDSVYMLLGHPETFETHTEQGHSLEISGFKLSNKSIPDLYITFEDGYLMDINKISMPKL